MNGALATYRNFALMSTLGSVTAAITNLTDLVFSATDNGLINTVKAIYGDNVITSEDLDLANSMREFQSSESSRWLDKVLKASGLVKLDIFGKNVYMNSAIMKAKELTEEQFVKKWGDQIGDGIIARSRNKDGSNVSATQQTYRDIQAGKNNGYTKFFAFIALSEVQPISLSETPIGYQVGGNNRIFWTLKLYSVKAINTFSKRLIHDIKNAETPKEKALVAANLGKLIILMTLAGAGVEELKDLLLGRDVEYSDHVMDSFLKIFFLNKYTLERGTTSGNVIENIVTDTLVPPLRLIDDPFSDLTNLLVGDEKTFKTLRNLPYGNIAYSMTDMGSDKTKANMKKDITKKYLEDNNLSDVRERMITYNNYAREEGLELISYESLRRARKSKDSREKKKLEELEKD
jgi:hypothetical protein